MRPRGTMYHEPCTNVLLYRCVVPLLANLSYVHLPLLLYLLRVALQPIT